MFNTSSHIKRLCHSVGLSHMEFNGVYKSGLHCNTFITSSAVRLHDTILDGTDLPKENPFSVRFREGALDDGESKHEDVGDRQS